jgi:ABC-2 type transport system ATP-binding protein
VEAEALTVRTPDLDDVFLSLTGRPPADGATPPRKEPVS